MDKRLYIKKEYKIVESLESICLNLIANNCHLIESCEYIPESIGHIIFKKSVELKYFELASNDQCKNVVSKFENKYKSLILDRLKLMPSMWLRIEDNLDFILSFKHLVSLHIYALPLGDDHPLIENIPYLLNLKKLILIHNCLSDKFLRKITTPIRIFNSGPKFLQHLNLSGNGGITAKSHVFFKRFKFLKFLNLTGTGYEIKQAENLASQLNLRLVTEPLNQQTSKQFEFYISKCYHQESHIDQTSEDRYLKNSIIDNLTNIENKKKQISNFLTILSGYIDLKDAIKTTCNTENKKSDMFKTNKSLSGVNKFVNVIDSDSEIYKKNNNDVISGESHSCVVVQKKLSEYQKQIDCTTEKMEIDTFDFSDSDVIGRDCCADVSWAKDLFASVLNDGEGNHDAIVSSSVAHDLLTKEFDPTRLNDLENLPMKSAHSFYSKYRKRSSLMGNFTSDFDPFKKSPIVILLKW